MAFAEVTLRSVTLTMDVKVNVIIPEDRHDYEHYDLNQKHKVLYVLHGTGAVQDIEHLVFLIQIVMFVVMPVFRNDDVDLDIHGQGHGT